MDDFKNLVLALRIRAANLKEKFSSNAMLLAELMDAADAIEELENKLNLWRQDKISRWIPVTERLPEPGVPCLCWCKGGTYGQIRWYGLYYLTSHRTWAFDDNDCIDNREVTHWMHRPEPPKEETE